MSVVQLVRCSCGIKSHPKQKCFFDDSCIPFCVGKQAADLSRLKFFPNRIAENFHQISNRITIFWTESLQFKSNLKICSNRNLNPITGPYVSPVWAVVMPMSKQPTLGSKHSAGWRPTTYDRILATTLHSSMATPLKNKKIKNNSKNKEIRWVAGHRPRLGCEAYSVRRTQLSAVLDTFILPLRLCIPLDVAAKQRQYVWYSIFRSRKIVHLKQLHGRSGCESANREISRDVWSFNTHTSRVIVSCSRSPVVGYLTRVHAQDLFKIDFVKFGFIF